MTNPILLFLSTVTVALLLVGVLSGFVPRAVAGFATIGLSGLGVLLCLLSLVSGAATNVLAIPIGPPGRSLQLALDPIAAYFLLVVFLGGTAVAAGACRTGQAATGKLKADTSRADTSRAGTAAAGTSGAGTSRELMAIPLCLAGFSTVLLASDAVTLVVGLTLASATYSLLDDAAPLAHALPPSSATKRQAIRSPIAVPAVLLLLIALCLLAPFGSASNFDGIHAVPVDPNRTTAAVGLAIVGGLSLLRHIRSGHHWTHDAFMAGAAIPCVLYLLVRLVLDLPGVLQAWWGFALLLAGGTIAVANGWQAARHPELDGSVACLTRRQAGLAVIGLGLSLIARSADLPDAASFGLAASLLLTIGSGVAGTLASLAAHALGRGAGSYRLARLGGLVQSMPIASVSLAASLLALSALPPGVGFAALWLLFQAILSAPRTGGLVFQLPLGLTAAALALSSALATAASVRLIGIAILSRPRSVRGSAAREVGSGLPAILLTLSGFSILLGLLPGLVLKALADPVVRALIGTGLGARAGWATLSTSAASPGYAALPLLALLALTIASVILIARRFRNESRIAGVWNEGLAPSPNMPFGDPVTQSAGAGFVPALPAIGWSTEGAPAAEPAAAGPRASAVPFPSLRNALMRRLTPAGQSPSSRLPATIIGLWAIVLAFSALLLVLSLFDASGIPG